MNTCTASNRTASTLRFSTIASLAGVFALSLVGSTAANAQTYVGNAYDAGVGVLFLGVGINNVTLPTAGGSVTHQVASISADASTLGLVAGNLSTGIATSTSIGSAGHIDSTSLINGVDVPLVNLSAVAHIDLQASVIGSDTQATFGGGVPTGSSTITNLFLNTYTLGSLTTSTQIVATGSPNQVVLGLPAGIASITLDEQVWNSDHSILTTNAIDIKAVGQTVGVTLGSSTAGFTGGAAAAPEPGSMTLIAAGLPFLIGGIGIGRRKLANRRSTAA